MNALASIFTPRKGDSEEPAPGQDDDKTPSIAKMTSVQEPLVEKRDSPKVSTFLQAAEQKMVRVDTAADAVPRWRITIAGTSGIRD